MKYAGPNYAENLCNECGIISAGAPVPDSVGARGKWLIYKSGFAARIEQQTQLRGMLNASSRR
jgi:hypothetical protein